MIRQHFRNQVFEIRGPIWHTLRHDMDKLSSKDLSHTLRTLFLIKYKPFKKNYCGSKRETHFWKISCMFFLKNSQAHPLNLKGKHIYYRRSKDIDVGESEWAGRWRVTRDVLGVTSKERKDLIDGMQDWWVLVKTTSGGHRDHLVRRCCRLINCMCRVMCTAYNTSLPKVE